MKTYWGKSEKTKENQSKRWVLWIERSCELWGRKRKKGISKRHVEGGRERSWEFCWFFVLRDKRKRNGLVLTEVWKGMYFTLRQAPFFLFCQPKRHIVVTSATHFCSCNLVCGSSPGPVMDLLGSFFCLLGLLSVSVLRKLELTSQAASYCLDVSNMWFWMDRFCALVFLFDLHLIIVWVN